MRWGAVATAACLVLALAACSDDEPSGDTTTSETDVPTFTASALPLPPPTGELVADMRQSSRDAAAGRMEVWILNDTTSDLTPTKVTYVDPRFRTSLPGERLREIPARHERGFPLYLPTRPTCGASNDAPVEDDAPLGTVEIEYAGRTKTVAVTDVTDVAGRFTRARCLEIAIGRVARLSWSDQVTPGVPEDTELGGTGTLTLVIDTTGRSGHELTIDTVSGTPVLAAVGSDVWRPDVTVHGDDEPVRVDLPLKPNRCDPHAFAESGGATAFKINLRLDGEPGQITLRMTTAGAANAIHFASASCGFYDRG